MLQHRQQQQVLEPHHGEIRLPLEYVDRSRSEGARPFRDLSITREVARLRSLRLAPLVVLGRDADDSLRPIVEVEHERRIERAQAVEVRRIEATRRVREAHVGHGARCIRPPGVHGPVGEPEVARQVAEQVEAERRRPEEVGPQPLVIETLVRFRRGRSGPRRLERAGGDEVRPGLAGVVEGKPTSDRPHRFVGLRHDRLRTDRVPVSLAPLRLVEAQRSAELGHRRSPRHVVVRFPAVRSLELLLGNSRGHVDIVRS